MINGVWGIGLGIALLAGLWLLYGSRASGAALRSAPLSDRRKVNASIYQEQLAQLQARHEKKDLSDAQFQTAKIQLDATLKRDLQAQLDWSSRPWGKVPKALLLILPVAVTAATFAYSNGAQHFKQIPQEAGGPPASIEEMVAGLQQRLLAEPDDLRGWAMLGRSYSVLERYPEAASAYARANVLADSKNAELLVAEAEALGMSQDQRLTGKPMGLLQSALELDPHHIQALWYALIASSQEGDASAKQAYLQRLGAEPELPQQLVELLRTEFNYEVTTVEAKTVGPAFEIEVSLGAQVLKQLPSDATLFVFAKAKNGPPMPLAVSRQALPQQWPVTIRLDDSMSMMPGQALSSYSAWTLVARVSKSGQAQGQSGDWQVQVDVSETPKQPIQLQIVEQIP